MSNAELLLPMTTTFLPAYASGPGCWEECCCSPVNVSAPGKSGIIGLPDMPVAMTRCVGCSVTVSPFRSSSTVHRLAASS